MIKHTPGPWIAVQGDNDIWPGWYVKMPEDAPNHRFGYIAEARHFTSKTDEVVANAYLIAAAPELLEACRGALEYVLEWPIGRDTSPQEQRGGAREILARHLQAVIRKATASEEE